jgi:N-acylneuraminate cytidylyltransferase
MVVVRTLVVIPARAGSKGILGKNLREVGGASLVARAVRSARLARLADVVVVTTDDEMIARAAHGAGARVVERPASLSGDDATSESAVLHVLGALEAEGSPVPDITVLMQCTSPFTVPADLDGVVTLVAEGVADVAFTATRTHAFLWCRDENVLQPVNHDSSVRPRRQDRRAEFVETGALYAMRTAGLLAAEHRFFGRVEVYEVPRLRSIEIDDADDLFLAQSIESRLAHQARGHALDPSPDALALDFDGVLTDNRVLTFANGNEAVISDRADGSGIEMLRDAGIRIAVFSKEQHPVVAARCAKLRLECFQGLDDKAPALRKWMEREALDPRNVVYVGNDVNDLECLQIVGCGVAPADAHPKVRDIADLVLSRPGGRGAIRELAELMLWRNDKEP